MKSKFTYWGDRIKCANKYRSCALDVSAMLRKKRENWLYKQLFMVITLAIGNFLDLLTLTENSCHSC